MWQLDVLKDDLINMSHYHLRPLPPIHTSQQELSLTHCIIDNREGSFTSRASRGVWDFELGFFPLSWGSHLDIFRKPFLFRVQGSISKVNISMCIHVYFVLILKNNIRKSKLFAKVKQECYAQIRPRANNK